MLEPLQQWICDRCAQVIERPLDGRVGWFLDRRTNEFHGFAIVHLSIVSVRDGDGKPCGKDISSSLRPFHQTRPLPHFSGEYGHVELVNLRSGSDQRSTVVPRIRCMKDWRELYLRLMVPYYEEARFFLSAALSHGHDLSGDNLDPEMLKAIVEQFGSTPRA